MSNKILVVFASRHGSTAGIAKAVGQTLMNEGYQVDVLPVNDVKSLSDYRAVVAGSAIQAGKWLPEAIDFIQRNSVSLKQLPFAAFQVCMTMAMPKADKYKEFVSSWMSPVSSIVKPKYEGTFAGVLDIKNIKSLGDRLKFRISVWFGVWKEGDHRNWDEIQDWAKGLKQVL